MAESKLQGEKASRLVATLIGVLVLVKLARSRRR
jgi:hypothetical protein